MRLGELLVAVHAASAEQIDQARSLQMTYGGRLGTNLVELGIIELDPLSTLLANLHHRPCTLEKHFELADRELQQRLPVRFAKQYACLPLYRVADRVIVTSVDPLHEVAVAVITAELGVSSKQIISAVAPELRIHYHLERVYGIMRDARFLRVGDQIFRPRVSGRPHVLDIELDDARRSLSELEVATAPTADAAIATVTEDDLGLAPSGLHKPPEALRRRVPSSSSPPVVEMREPAPEAVRRRVPSSSSPPVTDTLEPASSSKLTVSDLGLARGTRAMTPIPAPSGGPGVAELADEAIAAAQAFLASIEATTGRDDPAFASVEEAAEALRRCGDRDRLARLAIQAAVTLAPTEIAILLRIQDNAAIGITGINHGRSLSPRALAEIFVPLDQPGLIATAVLRKAVTRGASRTLGRIERRLYETLDCPHADLIAIPVTVSGNVSFVIAAVTERQADVSTLEAVAAATGVAFCGLLGR